MIIILIGPHGSGKSALLKTLRNQFGGDMECWEDVNLDNLKEQEVGIRRAFGMRKIVVITLEASHNDCLSFGKSINGFNGDTQITGKLLEVAVFLTEWRKKWGNIHIVKMVNEFHLIDQN